MGQTCVQKGAGEPGWSTAPYGGRLRTFGRERPDFRKMRARVFGK